MEDLLDVEAGLCDGLEVAESLLLAIFDYKNFVTVGKELQLMRHQYDKFVFENATYTLVENIGGNLRVNGTERIVK